MKTSLLYTGMLILLGFAPVSVISVSGQRATTPILSVSPARGMFYSTQLGQSRSLSFTLKNKGVSILNIKKVEIVGERFTITDSNTYPFEVVADSGVAFSAGNSGKAMSFSVEFSPVETGNFTGKIIITYGLWSDEIYEIQLTGKGLSCSEAIKAVKGENHAPGQNIWYKFTADKFSLVEINSCHPSQINPVTNPYRLLYFYAYDGCNGRLIPEVEEWTGLCQFDHEAIPVTTIMKAGQTIYIYWPELNPDSPFATKGFFFNINVTYPIDGDVCDNAIPLTLPVINLFGNTRGLSKDYSQSPCSVYPNYMGGNDAVYTINLQEDGYLTGNILGAYGSIHVLDECPRAELAKDHCKAFVGGPTGGQFRKKIAAGTYYVIISNWAPPQTLDYLINLSWEGTSTVENESLVNSLNVYPNPARDKFTVSVNNQEATNLTLELVNISGQVVYHHELKYVFGIQEEIDASSFAKGVYYLKVNTGKETAVRKVVIQ